MNICLTFLNLSSIDRIQFYFLSEFINSPIVLTARTEHYNTCSEQNMTVNVETFLSRYDRTNKYP